MSINGHVRCRIVRRRQGCRMRTMLPGALVVISVAATAMPDSADEVVPPPAPPALPGDDAVTRGMTDEERKRLVGMLETPIERLRESEFFALERLRRNPYIDEPDFWLLLARISRSFRHWDAEQDALVMLTPAEHRPAVIDRTSIPPADAFGPPDLLPDALRERLDDSYFRLLAVERLRTQLQRRAAVRAHLHELPGNAGAEDRFTAAKRWLLGDDDDQVAELATRVMFDPVISENNEGHLLVDRIIRVIRSRFTSSGELRFVAEQLRSGEHIPASPAIAARWLERGLEHLPEGLQHLSPSLEVLLGELHFSGELGRADPARAMDHFMRAAMQDDAAAHYWVGVLHRDGALGAVDLPAAAEAFARGAQQLQRDGRAACALALLMDQGHVQADEPAIRFMSLRAARGELPLAKRRALADMAMRRSDAVVLESVASRDLLSADPELAVRLLGRSAELGRGIAAMRLANHLLEQADDGAAAGIDRRVRGLLVQAADDGLPAAAATLGDGFSGGWFGDVDHAAAEGWWRVAAARGHVPAAIALVRAADESRAETEPFEVLTWLRLAAESGDREWMVELARRREAGIGVPIDDAEAVHWWRRAAERNVPQASYTLGLRYRDGRGVEQDPDRAIRLISRAAQAGVEGAQRVHAELLESAGRTDEAMRAYRLAARANDPEASLAFVRLAIAHGGVSAEQIAEAAMPALQDADPRIVERADAMLVQGLDDAAALRAVATRYLQMVGRGDRRRDPLERDALRWIVRAAEAGDRISIAWLAEPAIPGQSGMPRVVLRAIPAEEITALAAFWIIRAAEAGMEPALRELVRAADERGDDDERTRWLRSGADAGNAWSMGMLAQHLERTASDDAVHAEAEQWWRKAAELGDSLARDVVRRRGL